MQPTRLSHLLKSKKTLMISAGLVPCALAAGFVACGTSEKTSGGSTATSYAGLGSRWGAEFDGSDFTITYDKEADGSLSGTDDFTVEGTFEEFDSGFKKLTAVTVTKGATAQAPSADDEAYALEIPGFGLFVQPIGSTQSEPIVMLKSGECPTEANEANWIIANFKEDIDSGTGLARRPSNGSSCDGFGSASFTVDGAAVTGVISQRKFTDGVAISGGPTIAGTCADGVNSFDDPGNPGETGTMLLTANGGALVNSPGGLIFAAPRLSADVTSSDWNGEYSAIAFTGSNTFPARITLNGTSGTGVQYTDVEAGTVSSGGVTLASLAVVAGSQGNFSGTIDTGSGDGPLPLNCMLSETDGQKVLACNGASDSHSYPGGPSSDGATTAYKSFFILGVQQ